MKNTPYIQHEGKVVETGGKFTHVMAIALDPTLNYKEGVIRCITSREGDVTVSGYIDRSEIWKIKGDSLEKFSIIERLKTNGTDKIIQSLSSEHLEFIGFEDPDIFIDEAMGLTHIYFTLPFLNRKEKHALVHLGHVVGKDLDSLTMTEPVLLGDPKTYAGAKEVSIAPINSKGVRLNLFESSKKEADFTYSTVRVAIAEDMNKPWKWGDTVFHPKEHGIPWIAGHASPGPLLPKSFIDIGEGKLLGIMNGREANQKVGNQTKYGMFSAGLFIYDYEKGKIDWVSPEPLIRDTEAVTITFASQFIETTAGEGILYAHVDDSFVRAYTLFAERIKKMLPMLQ
ncbi:MAG TPA: hypothetical protein VL335_03605 [Candidatus Paceibacterota bacterium]|jgi:hypothetical protein|nr:hypothetical protein [Candidatus Paceibacterota bacterium]